MSFSTAPAPSTAALAPTKSNECKWDRENNTKESKNIKQKDSTRLLQAGRVGTL